MRKTLYEKWSFRPLCSRVAWKQFVTVDFKDPLLAKRRIHGQDRTYLSRIENNAIVPSANADHVFHARRWVISKPHCEFAHKSGKFYTDAYGKSVKKGAAPDSVAQFLKKNV